MEVNISHHSWFNGDFETYSTFLSHLKLRLGDSNVIFVSDKEWALTKAIQYNFPNSIYLLCLKHLKTTFEEIWKKGSIVQQWPGRNCGNNIWIRGIAKISDDSIFLETNYKELEPVFQIKVPTIWYFEQRIKWNLVKHVIEPIDDSIVEDLWTSNNTESMNHRMKQEIIGNQVALHNITNI